MTNQNQTQNAAQNKIQLLMMKRENYSFGAGSIIAVLFAIIIGIVFPPLLAVSIVIVIFIAINNSIEKQCIPTPCIESKNSISFISSAKTLDDCEKSVLEKAHHFLTKIRSMSANDAVRFMSLTGDLQVCQVVDPLKTMRFTFHK